MHTRLAIALAFLGLIVGTCNYMLAAESADKTVDLLKGAIDPYIPGTERSTFLRAAGVDSELDEEEFQADLKKGVGFARPYERFASVLLFDNNRDKQIDWFEADAYRRALRVAVLSAFDKDNNRRLTGDERTRANEALAAGKLPRIAAPRSASGSRPDSSRPSRPAPQPNDRTGRTGRDSDVPTDQQRRAEWEQVQARLAKKYDQDGNGRLNTREEWDAARNEIRDYYSKREIERFDSNNDGRVSEEERRAGRERDMRVGLKRRHDTNRDGELTGGEQQNYDRALQQVRDKQEHDQEARKQFMSKFDENDDGELNDQEKKAIGPYYEKIRAEVNATALKNFDRDGDGKLNEAERNAGRESVTKEANEKFDTDGDGELNFRERTNAMRSDPETAEWLFHMYVRFSRNE